MFFLKIVWIRINTVWNERYCRNISWLEMFEIRTHHRGENISAAYSKLLQETIQWKHIFGNCYRQWNGWMPRSFQQSGSKRSPADIVSLIELSQRPLRPGIFLVCHKVCCG